jgi:sigma-B regulation protein RsbU (phosphoserine phosphatase)
MAIADMAYTQTVREQLQDRRARLEDVLTTNQTAQLQQLLDDVDQALHKIDTGSFGMCEVCHDSIESDRLLADPMIKVCLGCLTPAQQRALEYDLELAAQIQSVALPQCATSFAGWDACYHFQPVGVVSGDYCDLMSDGKGGLFFILADVAGKGVAAAMLAANLRAMFRALIPLNLSTEKLLSQASRLFRESTLPMHYATLVFGRASVNGELELVNAGHLPALLIQPTGVTAFESKNLPLGVFTDQQFTADKTRLSPGDCLVLYTDGISEAQNEAGEEYGSAALRKLIEERGLCCPERVVHAAREQVAQFRGSRLRTDDETLLAIQWTPGASEDAQRIVAKA